MHHKILERKLLDMIEEDTGFHDITSTIVPDRVVKAEIISKSEGTISGISELKILFTLFKIDIIEPPVSEKPIMDGDNIKRNQKIFNLSGNSRDILVVERTALNILSRMSGVSTLTREFIKKARKTNPTIRIAATRKTTPLFGYFEKHAVRIAGGDTHRHGLGDLVLIKDNHLVFFGGVKSALQGAMEKTSFTHKIEIEVNNIDDAILAAGTGADIIMLDNMPVTDVREAVSGLKRNNLRNRVIVEASGGINLENIGEYAKTGVDVISIGAITHSAPALDFSLDLFC